MIRVEAQEAVALTVWMSEESRHPMRFLLVEDDVDHAEILRRELKKARITNDFHWVRNGKQAMDFLKKRGEFAGVADVDALILDLKLPKKDGHEVLSEIREDSELWDLPVAVVSTSSAEVDLMRAFKYRANSYLVKPLDLECFHTLVSDLSCVWAVGKSPWGRGPKEW